MAGKLTRGPPSAMSDNSRQGEEEDTITLFAAMLLHRGAAVDCSKDLTRS